MENIDVKILCTHVPEHFKRLDTIITQHEHYFEHTIQIFLVSRGSGLLSKNIMPDINLYRKVWRL